MASAFWAEFYGTRHIGAIKAMAAALMVFGSAIGPGLTGALIDLDDGELFQDPDPVPAVRELASGGLELLPTTNLV